ncbi:MAG: hypothetical protein IT373_05115 [Polyangiaceae bacterium]|nr:hypothetical protein [Polyangiaceae bacterium]
MRGAVPVLGTVVALAASAGCESGSVCGATPTPFEVVDVSPAPGSVVAAAPVVHSFTLVSPPGVFRDFTFAYGSAHSAGAPVPATLHFVITSTPTTVHYELGPVTWSSPPGDVVIDVPETYQAPDGCAYVFPSPLFDYTVAGSGGGP